LLLKHPVVTERNGVVSWQPHSQPMADGREEKREKNGKSEAEVTIIKDCARGIALLKLTTDGHKVSRGLSATAELLVP